MLPTDEASRDPLDDKRRAVVSKHSVDASEQIKRASQLLVMAATTRQEKTFPEDLVADREPCIELAMFYDFLIGHDLVVQCLQK